MAASTFKDYFSFTKKERMAVVILVLLITVIFILPYVLPQKKGQLNKADWQKFKSQLAQIKVADTNSAEHPVKKNDYDPDIGFHQTARNNGSKTKSNQIHVKSELFYFDPNTLSAEGWERLGLQERNVHTIRNYISKGGRFRFPEDMEKIYGLNRMVVENLKPYVRIAGGGPDKSREKPAETFQSQNHAYTFRKIFVKPVIDLNTADTTLLISLPGIGSKLSNRIVRFREKIGGFNSINQLSEVYGLTDSTIQKILPQLTIADTRVKTLNINTAGINDLQEHPYLKGVVAHAIIEYRTQHGEYSVLEDLHQIDIITPEIFKKIAPYLTTR